MARWLETSSIQKTQDLLANILVLSIQDNSRVQFLCDPSTGAAVVQRLRVALSRSRAKNKSIGRKINEFTLCHEIYPYTVDGIRHDCVVMWVEKSDKHIHRELLDDIVERN